MEKLSQLVCVKDFEETGMSMLDKNTLGFFAGGADEEETLRENPRAFKRWLLRPRILRDVSKISLTKTVLGKPVNFPLGVSPMGILKMAHPDAEIACAKAASTMGTIFIQSTVSTTSMEDVEAATPGSRKWFQLYIYTNRNWSMEMVRRAEKAGFEALVLTVDAPKLGKRREGLRTKFNLPSNLKYENFPEGSAESDSSGSFLLSDYVNKYYDKSLTWDDLAWFKSVTKLPVIVKGILTGEDAKLAVDHGIAAVFISNHGGRQLDTVSATMDVLEEVVREVKGKCEIYLDGGVRTGSDIFKALALGATMVFAGRPVLWGLTIGGEEGARKILQIFKDELDLTMTLSGVTSIEGITAEYLSRKSCH